MNLKKLYIYISIIFVILIGFIGFNTYNKFYKANIIEDGYLYIPTKSTYDDVETIVRPFLERVNTFPGQVDLLCGLLRQRRQGDLFFIESVFSS